ncbi:MAG: GNAT family N-acetyltransferase [Dehalococcoidia bacterium]
MTQVTAIRRATGPSDQAAITETLALAFANDPVCQWVWQSGELAHRVSRDFFAVFSGMVLEAGEALLHESKGGAALWLTVDPENDVHDEAFGAALAEACGPFVEKLGIIDELMSAAHPKKEIHAYLPFIGVRPEQHGRGIGGELLASKLIDVDREGLPAYLEATTLTAARLYERHGFVRLPHTIDLPDGPSMYPMWREARRI